MSYRGIIYAGTLLTGLTGLVYQVVWQKYLSFIVGSEARSVALVVAIFLIGLATGYRFWGRLTERVQARRTLLRAYGAIEIGIGVYAALFPLYFRLLTWIGHHGPSSLLTDLLLTALTLLLPTFLMGATIPLLVSVIPIASGEVHLCHAKVYGINTLGACAGAFGASFYLIPELGLQGSLIVAAAINVVVGTTFLLNTLQGSVAKEQAIEAIPHNFPIQAVYLFTLVTGTITLSLEVACVRVLGLTIGSGPHNFAIVVGVFILGLALGSLLLTGKRLSVRVLFRSVTFLILYLVALFYTVPFWPYWLNNARVSLRSIPPNYDVYLGVVTGFLMLVLLPFLIPLGAMLPLTYSLIPKGTSDYGRKCGRLYFYNTLGTVVGAILFSYVLLAVVDLDVVFKIDVALLAGMAAYLLLREKRLRTAAVLTLIVVAFLFAPGWDRASHYVGLFRNSDVAPFNFQGVFDKPRIAPRVVEFSDGPDATVTVVEYDQGTRIPQTPPPEGAPPPEPVTSRAIVINGKADGDTLLDYSAITLAALLPYFHAPDRADLQAAVVGMGTGITSGVLAQSEDVSRVAVLEISSTLVDFAPAFDHANYGLTTHPKVEILPVDGFKYFARVDGDLDIVVSATSPPWVVGVENLFTPEFYALARQALTDDGVFFQWFPLYSMDASSLHTILANLRSVFPHLRLYRISYVEMGILASARPLSELVERRFYEPDLQQVRATMQLNDPDLLLLVELFETKGLEAIVANGESRVHTLARPALAYASDRVRFVNAPADWNTFIDERVARLLRYSDERRDAFGRMLGRYPSGLHCTEPTPGPQLFCERYNRLLQAYAILSQGSSVIAEAQAFDILRQEGLQPLDPGFLAHQASRLVESNPDDLQALQAAVDTIVLVYAKDGLWDEALRDLKILADAGLITAQYHEHMSRQIQSGREAREKFVQLYGG